MRHMINWKYHIMNQSIAKLQLMIKTLSIIKVFIALPENLYVNIGSEGYMNTFHWDNSTIQKKLTVFFSEAFMINSKQDTVGFVVNNLI